MSLLPNDLTPGSTAVIPMLTEAGPTQAFFAPASGGGGGVGSTINCDFVFVNSSITTLALTANSTINAPQVIGYTGQLYLNSGGSGVTTWTGNNGTFISQNNQKVIELNGSASAPGQCQFNNFSVVNMANTELSVSSINGQIPNSAVIPEDLSVNSLTASAYVSTGAVLTSSINASTIRLSGFPVPLFQNGRFVMPNANSNVIETDIVFSGTDWGAWAGYDGAVNSAVSSIGTSVLSRSTFAVYAQGGLGVSWQVLGN